MPPTFTFESQNVPRKAYTARRVHIRRLLDLVELSVQREDWESAWRGWAILTRCKEVQWRHLWRLGLLMVSGHRGDSASLDYLRAMMFQHPEQASGLLKEAVLQEIAQLMITQEDYRGALAELQLPVLSFLSAARDSQPDSYLPSLPYQDNPVLHTYAGMLCLYLAQPSVSSASQPVSQYSQPTGFNQGLMRDVETHLKRALSLDPANLVAAEMLKKSREILQDTSQRQQTLVADSDTEIESEELPPTPPHKRLKAT
ncbi:hypothetical protein AURDEDRAFT_179937 [Auricularia subglabra TFB-10046 SS5]|nr:hypothetical protein AURDEDRAFT_179937 [Auricularia subglabra TFB-10046 SS5]